MHYTARFGEGITCPGCVRLYLFKLFVFPVQVVCRVSLFTIHSFILPKGGRVDCGPEVLKRAFGGKEKEWNKRRSSGHPLYTNGGSKPFSKIFEGKKTVDVAIACNGSYLKGPEHFVVYAVKISVCAMGAF